MPAHQTQPWGRGHGFGEMGPGHGDITGAETDGSEGLKGPWWRDGPGLSMVGGAQGRLVETARISISLEFLTTHTSVLDTIFCPKLLPVIVALPSGLWYCGQHLQWLHLHIAQMGRSSPQETNACGSMIKSILDLL